MEPNRNARADAAPSQLGVEDLESFKASFGGHAGSVGACVSSKGNTDSPYFAIIQPGSAFRAWTMAARTKSLLTAIAMAKGLRHSQSRRDDGVSPPLWAMHGSSPGVLDIAHSHSLVQAREPCWTVEYTNFACVCARGVGGGGLHTWNALTACVFSGRA